MALKLAVSRSRPSVPYGANLFGILKYVCDIIVKQFTFAISSPDEFLSVLSQEIGWEERPRNDLFFVGWDVKP